MTDQTIPDVTDEERMLAREWAEFIESRRCDWTDRIRAAARVLKALLPPPPRPTLADMTEEEQNGCKWMQADTESWGRVVILNPCAIGGNVTLVDDRGAVAPENRARVTPRPDLPRMEWPGDTPTGQGHLAVGAVIESADDPRIDALPVGSILLDRDEEAAIKGRGDWTGAGYIPIPSEYGMFAPWTVLHIPKEKA